MPGILDVGGVDQTAELTASLQYFSLRWGKEARSDMLRKVEAEASKMAEAQGEDVASESSAGGKSSVVPGKRASSSPPNGIWEGARSLSGWANLQAGGGAVGE